MLITSRPVRGSISFQNGRSTSTKVLDDCIYLVRSRAAHIFWENSDSSQSIWVVSSQFWQVISTAGYRRTSPQASVTASWPSGARAIFATPALGAPECSEASEVPAGQWAG